MFNQLFILSYYSAGRRCSKRDRLFNAHQFIRSGWRRRTGADAWYGYRPSLRYCRFFLVLWVTLFDCVSLWRLKQWPAGGQVKTERWLKPKSAQTTADRIASIQPWRGRNHNGAIDQSTRVDNR